MKEFNKYASARICQFNVMELAIDALVSSKGSLQ